MVKYITFRQQERWFVPDVLMLIKELRNKLKSQYTSADNAEAGSELDGLVKATPHIKVFLQGPSQGADRKGTREGLPAHSLPVLEGQLGTATRVLPSSNQLSLWTKFPL